VVDERRVIKQKLSSLRSQKIPLATSGKSVVSLRASCARSRGTLAIVTNVGRGMRWTLVVCQTNAPKRTAKSCGLDASTLASTRDNASALRGDGGKKARSPERARRKPLKPIAQEKPERFGGPVVTNSCLLFFDTRLRVRISIRLFLRPLFSRDTVLAKLGQNMSRECGSVSRLVVRHIIRDAR
jgi:hypothetical protein